MSASVRSGNRSDDLRFDNGDPSVLKDNRARRMLRSRRPEARRE
jgi:hypothetical protein